MTSTWRVALCAPPYRTFTYSTPAYLPEQAWAVGQRVMVPVGRAFRLGVISSRSDDSGFSGREIKPLGWPVDRELLLTDQVMEVVRHLALRQMLLEGQVLAAVLPKALRSTNVVFALSGLGASRKRVSMARALQAPLEEQMELGRAWLEGRLTILARERRTDAGAEYELLCDPPWDVRPRAKRQMALLDHLFVHGRTDRRVLQQVCGPDILKVLKDLTRKGLVQAVPCLDEAHVRTWTGPDGQGGGVSAHSPDDTVVLSGEQTAALAALESDLEQALVQGRGVVRLVHGVTGSGKTLLYLRLAASCLARGRSVLLLAPEVALSAQLWSEVCRAFPGARRHWYHGYLTPGAKLAVFRSLLRGGAQIVVGTRSALFLPFADLGLVVMDEEHDASYKQDEGLPYQAKEVAYFRIRRGGVLALGSATPDIKTHYAAEQGEIAMVRLKRRLSPHPTPEIILVDMRQEAVSEPLSRVCREELCSVLERGEQAMFLLNRRGFAPLVFCLDCGRSPQCPHCEVGLTYHKGWERLLCHYCGYAVPFPCVCGQCGGSRFLPLGEGTEGLEERLEALLPPDQAVVRLDRDATRRKGRMEDILSSFGQGRAQVMVGTQMISKGHHFPKVTLVAAVNGDIGLNLPDYRAAEKTFQLLVQLAGRAGRGERPGRVLIQTRNPGHPCWTHILAGDYEGFFAQELERRKKFAYPPFVKLGMIRFSYPWDWARGESLLARAGECLLSESSRRGMRALGPAPAPLSRIKDRKRFHCLLKSQQWQDIREVYGALHKTLPRTSPLRVSLDLDPVNML